MAEDRLIAERKGRGVGGGGVPSISLKPWFEGGEAGRAHVAREWDRACREVGFLVIVDHGVPARIISECWEASVEFFDRPLDEKRAVPMTEEYPYGYQGVGMENLLASLDKENASPGDLKELFNVCLGPEAPLDPELLPPRWPARSERMRYAWTEYYRALQRLSEELYGVCALALGLPIDWFADKIGRHRNCLRAINYPEQRHAPTPGQLRASTHTDYGALTILRLGGAHPGGLQALGLGGEWVAVQDASDGFVINLGDLMARWTNDRWLSTPHRVVNPADGEAARARRQSLAYFVNVNMDADIECIPTCHGDDGSKYPTIKAGEHLLTKHQQTVAGKLCYEAAASSSSAAAGRSSTPTPTPMDAEAASATPTPMR